MRISVYQCECEKVKITKKNFERNDKNIQKNSGITMMEKIWNEKETQEGRKKDKQQSMKEKKKKKQKRGKIRKERTKLNEKKK